MSQIRITLPDNSIKTFDNPITIAGVAESIGPRLAKASVGGKIDGVVSDIRTPITSDCKLEIITADKPDAVEIIRHSAAHIMAQAIQALWPEIKVTIGPVIDTGFFYDFDTQKPFLPEDLEKVEKKMKEIISADIEIVREEWPIQKAIDTFAKMGENFKVEIIQDLQTKDGAKTVSIYHQGDWFDLCRGPHVPRTSFVKAIKLMSIAGAYWRGDEKNKMLQRIYGTAFGNQKDLDAYLLQVEEAKKRDHRKLGKELGLFAFHQWAPAMPFFTPKGTVVYNELQKYIRELYVKYDYQEVITPQVFDVDLFHKSGHYENYLENMYFIKLEDEKPLSLKPMNCPGHCLLFGTEKRSYRDLPWRMADFGRLHRHERAGVVHGMTRVRSMCQDDAHIFCRVDQIQSEIITCINFLNEVYDKLGLTYSIFLSTRPEKRAGSDEVWDKAECALETALKALGTPYKVNAGDGAFYGPKLDIMATDAIGRQWQLATLQCDFIMPERFELEYTGEDNKGHRPVMIHRAILGTFERFIGVFIEHVNGAFPTWLHPVQVVLCNINEIQADYVSALEKKLKALGVRVQNDSRNEKLGFKIREAQLQKIPYMIVVGEQEKTTNTLSVRRRTGEEKKGVPIEEFINKLTEEIKTRSFTLTI